MLHQNIFPVGLVATIGVAACGIGVIGVAGDTTSPTTEDPTQGDGAASRDGSTTFHDGDINVDGAAVDVQAIEAGVDALADAGLTAGSALRFTGGSYVRVGALAIPTSFTLEAWIRPSSFAAERYVVARDRANEGKGQFRFGLDATGHLFFMISDANGDDHGLYNNGYKLLSPTALAQNTWSHVAVTKDGALFVLYINGVSVSTATATAAFSYGGPTIDFRIGARVASDGTGVNGAFEGTIDEVRIWSVAQSAAQIAAKRLAPIFPTDEGFASLAAYYRFDEGVGTMAADAKGGLTGSLVSSPLWVLSTAF